ncbi:trace amine-associated receptor 13c-like [Electrophorus electricus]|uniref:trace amine-associated receptor 13c-like n=1 Tax=Electrophorus electricus TaxID=8005 RepID=UPI0015D02142|nr:trace amine-associated receptor 13c-like [Electrophorus electricus]XP_026867761.2 trace amine-associated receptor 13c-like [Electrophorus electricus]
MANASVPWGTGVLMGLADPNQTVDGSARGGLPLVPLCTMCCCGLLNHALTVVFMVTLAFAIVIGNVVTLTVFMQTRQSRTPQGYLKVSLAIADMIVGVLVVPFSVYTEISLMVTSAPPVWFEGGAAAPARGGSGSTSWQPCMLIGPVFASCTFVSISTIFLMTVERSVAILRPLHKDTLVTRRRTLLLILISWVGSFLLASAPLVLSANLTLEYNGCSRMCNYVPQPANANVMLLFPAFDFTLLGGTLAANALSFTCIRRYAHKRKRLSEGGQGPEAAASGGSSLHRPSFSDIKAAKTIGILTFAFTASFSPIAVFVLGNVVGHVWCDFSFFAFWILTGNSCCNVIIYSMRDHRFRKGVTLLFQKDRSPPHSEKS